MRAFDVLVIGGGPAGSTAAIALARAGFAVALAEKAAFPRRKVCGEFVSAAAWPLLDAMGVGARLRECAGPAVRRVGFFSGEASVCAPMPAAATEEAFGRAVGREILDTLLLDRARECGAVVFQPCRVDAWVPTERGWSVTLEEAARGVFSLEARALIDAGGSWQRIGGVRASDLLGFKARFERAALPADLMPLVLFPGGYGGLVHSDGGRVSFSCCIRRDALRECRDAARGAAAGEAVLAHVMRHCAGVREALGGAVRDAAWLAAGPMRPGIRVGRDAILAVGNAAGEAHPLVAEGISMAIQSAWLLAEEFRREDSVAPAALAAIGARYGAAWHRHLALRVRASQAFAALSASRATLAATRAVLTRAPAVLAWGALLSGKAHALRPAPAAP